MGLRAGTGNFCALSGRSSVKLPWPCISRIATNAFQYGIEPQPVYVWRFTPARPYAGGISVAALRPSGWKALASMNSSASNLPGPHDARPFLTVGTSTPSTPATGLRFGAAEMIAPTLRSRLGQPSRRWPMPGANELFTVEWQTAQVNPIDVIRPEEEKGPLTPTTALSLISASVVFGELRSTLPALIALTTDFGSALASTLRPSFSAVAGLTPGPTPPLALPSIALLS